MAFTPRQLDSHQQQLFSNYFLLASKNGVMPTASNQSLNTGSNRANAVDISDLTYAPMGTAHLSQSHPYAHFQAHLENNYQDHQHLQNEQGQPQDGELSARDVAISENWLRAKRDSHKEVERRRRGVIASGIEQLAELIPAVEKKQEKIIKGALQYIQELKAAEESNLEKWTVEKSICQQAIQEMSNTVAQLAEENRALTDHLVHLQSNSSGGSNPGDANRVSFSPHFDSVK
ncbi:hypothetical protein CcCBS67573_g03932 [Chytriomyces confervae]|uniref:BHLH domain-containing protein n=1 Tax=Chytriomyces confervae TaxID=246404 RepID=A0A507FGP1_9FUNG|nr:hypothetical protein CcCBS67573_g03932 [Chytriomyces confervae]